MVSAVCRGDGKAQKGKGDEEESLQASCTLALKDTKHAAQLLLHVQQRSSGPYPAGTP